MRQVEEIENDSGAPLQKIGMAEHRRQGRHDRLNYYRALTCLPIQIIALFSWTLGVEYSMAAYKIISLILIFSIIDINYVQHYHAHGSLTSSPTLDKFLSFQLGICSGMDVHNWHLQHIYKAHHDFRSDSYPGKMTECDKNENVTLFNIFIYIAKSATPILLMPLFNSIRNLGRAYEFVNSKHQTIRVNYTRAATHQILTYMCVAAFIYAAPILFATFYVMTISSTILTNYITHKANGRYFKDGAIYLNPTYNSAQLLFGLHAAHHRMNDHYTMQVRQLRYMFEHGQLEQAQIVKEWPACFLWSGLFTVPGLLSLFQIHPFQRSSEFYDFLALRNEIGFVFDIREESFMEYIRAKLKIT